MAGPLGRMGMASLRRRRHRPGVHRLSAHPPVGCRRGDVRRGPGHTVVASGRDAGHPRAVSLLAPFGPRTGGAPHGPAPPKVRRLAGPARLHGRAADSALPGWQQLPHQLLGRRHSHPLGNVPCRLVRGLPAPEPYLRPPRKRPRRSPATAAMGRRHLVDGLHTVLHLVFPPLEARRQDPRRHARGIRKGPVQSRLASGGKRFQSVTGVTRWPSRTRLPGYTMTSSPSLRPSSTCVSVPLERPALTILNRARPSATTKAAHFSPLRKRAPTGALSVSRASQTTIFA